MGFKADESFIRYLTMGARGVHSVIAELEAHGLQPIELERYCGSNKIWSTKIKRLRLPDLLCVSTGLRIEVRAKSDLSIKMSDAPGNPDRVWDSGLEDDDLAAFVACFDSDTGPRPAEQAMYVRVGDMRASERHSKLGPPKSASEGAERDREWPTTVPKRAGEVLDVADEKIVVNQFACQDKKARRQTYQLRGKTPYVSVGDRFDAGTSFLAGAPRRLASLEDYLSREYQPLVDLLSPNPIDRYAAAKALPFRDDHQEKSVAGLEALIVSEDEHRIRLEAAGSATYFGSRAGEEALEEYVWAEHSSEIMKMEAVLILAELGSSEFTTNQLREIAGSQRFHGSEIRQAAIWGLGKAGYRRYEAILPYIADEEENVALHAIAAFDSEAPDHVVNELIMCLVDFNERITPAASETLRIIGSAHVISSLGVAYHEYPEAATWIMATLGRMSPGSVRGVLQGHPVLDQLEPMFLFAEGVHWLSSETISKDISFLLKQNL